MTRNNAQPRRPLDGRKAADRDRVSCASTTMSTRTLATLLVSAAALLTGLAACGDASDRAPPIPREDFVKELAAAVCDNIGPCCMTEGFSFEQAACHTTADREAGEFFAPLLTDGIAYDGAAARECVDKFAELARTCSEMTTLGSGCARIFRGARTLGETCTSSAECANGGCGPQGGTSEPKCQATSASFRAKSGEPCNATCSSADSRFNIETVCGRAGPGTPPPMQGSCFTNDGLYCSTSFVCVAIPAVGQACDTAPLCSGSAFCENGTCTPRRTAGSCENPDTCSSAAYCDFTTRECRPKAAIGAACTSTAECQTPSSCTDGVCRRQTIANQKMCNGDF